MGTAFGVAISLLLENGIRARRGSVVPTGDGRPSRSLRQEFRL